MERIFYIGPMQSDDDLNRITLALNDLEEVSRIKIAKNSVTFNCARPDSVTHLLEELDMDYVLKEEVNSRKREYVAPERKGQQIFMFTHLETEEEANEIKEVLSKYSVYENVEVDFTNKLLMLTTSHKNPLVRINRLVEKINPEIQVEQWKKPFKSQDLFQDKYLSRYLRIAILMVGISLGLVTQSDPTFLTGFGWLLALIVVGESDLKRAWRDIKVKQYLSENVLMNVACLAGWAFGAYIEAIVVSLLYQLGARIGVRVMNWTIEKIDNLVNVPVMVSKLEKQTIIEVPVEDIDIGDTIVVSAGQTIPLGGFITKGKAKFDEYAINGNEVLVRSKIGNEVFSGTVVEEGEIQMKVASPYQISATNKIIEIAMMAPLSKSRTNRIIEMVSLYYTRILVLLALICCTIIPMMDWTDNRRYLYLGAIMLTVSGSYAYKQGASLGVLAGIGKAFSKKIVIEENSGLDDLNLCRTIIYDRFDGVEVTEEEMDLFAKIKKMHKELIVFNDGPVDLENDEYNIYNNLTVEEKMEIMEKAKIIGEVAYIGDCDKDVALLQKAFVGISRGGIHNHKVIKNSDILLTDSSLDTIIDLLKISKKQKHVIAENIIFGVVISLFVVLVGLQFIMPWWIAGVVSILEIILILMNTLRIIMD